MTDGLDTTLGFLGLIGTGLQLLECAYVATDREGDLAYLRCQLEFEALMLRRWAECVLLVRAPDGTDTVKIVPPGCQRLVRAHLNQILDLFGQSSDVVEQHDPRPTAGATSPTERNRLCRAIAYLQVARPRAVTWAVRDSNHLSCILNKIKTIRRNLQELLPADPALLGFQVLADTISAGSVEGHLSVMREALQRMQNEDDVGANFVSSMLALRAQLSPWVQGGNEQLDWDDVQAHHIADAQFPPGGVPPGLKPWYTSITSQQKDINNIHVMVEWRPLPVVYRDNRNDFERDVAELAHMLVFFQQYPNAHLAGLPHCLGYIVDDSAVSDYSALSSTRFGLVFRIADLADHDEVVSIMMDGDIPRKPATLEEVITHTWKTGGVMPALDQRWQLARGLSVAVFQVMCQRWLHKGVMSCNVLLPQGIKLDFPREGSPSLVDFILTGFTSTRRNRVGQLTWGRGSENLDFRRHRAAMSDRWNTPEYNAHGYLAEFDVYGLGTILLELGLWMPLQTVRDKAERREGATWSVTAFPQFLQARVDEHMPGRMGAQYTRIVRWCLDILPASSTPVPINELLVDFEENVLSPLGVERYTNYWTVG